jgi:hypothetical protein
VYLGGVGVGVTFGVVIGAGGFFVELGVGDGFFELGAGDGFLVEEDFFVELDFLVVG